MKKDVFFFKGEYLCSHDNSAATPRSAAEQTGDFEMVTIDVPDETTVESKVIVDTKADSFEILGEAFDIKPVIVEPVVVEKVLSTKIVPTIIVKEK